MLYSPKSTESGGSAMQNSTKRVTFYRNGDRYDRGIIVCVNNKLGQKSKIDGIDTSPLLEYLNNRLDIPGGVKYIFSLHDGRQVTDISEYVAGRSYVASATPFLKQIKYGQFKENHWQNRAPSGGKVRKSEVELYDNKPAGAVSRKRPSSPDRQWAKQTYSTAKPVIITIISNTDRTSRQTVIFNPLTAQTFDAVLDDINNMLQIKYPPVKTLYTNDQHFKKISSMSQFKRALANCSVFLACGGEAVPVELSNDYKITTTPVHNSPVKYEVLQPLGTQYNNYRPINVANKKKPATQSGSPLSTRKPTTSQSYTSYDSDSPFRKALPDSYSIKVHIHGTLREFHLPRIMEREPDSRRPEETLQLDWVYGYRGRDSIQNLHILPSGELLYFASTVAILYNVNESIQRHYCEHNEEITALAVRPTIVQSIVATAQLTGRTPDSKAHIKVWDSKNLKTMAVLGQNVFQKILSLNFSTNSGSLEIGSYLLATDEAEKYTVTMWDWKHRSLITKTTTSSLSVIWGAFHPKNYTDIVTYGYQHLSFWKLSPLPNKSRMNQLLKDKWSFAFRDSTTPKFVTAVAFSLNGDVITGDSNGRIMIWTKNEDSAFVLNFELSDHLEHAHDKSVFSLVMLKDGILISGGGTTLKAWNSNYGYRMTKSKTISELNGTVRTIAARKDSSRDSVLYVGTANNFILQGSFHDQFESIVEGYNDELWAVATHPAMEKFVCAGYDSTIRQYDYVNQAVLWENTLEIACSAVDYHPSGVSVVLGTVNGRLIALNTKTGKHVASIQVGNNALSVIKFSPDGNFLAAGSHDSSIYIYRVVEDAQIFRKHKHGTLKGHSKFVTHIDWSVDGAHLRSVSGDYDLLFWNAIEMKMLDAEEVTSVMWSDHSCVLGYNVLGAWSNLKKSEDINVMALTTNRRLLCVGNNQGSIMLYRYPCTSERPDCHSRKAYTGHVSALRFSRDNRFLLASGGNPAVVMQFRVINSLMM